MDNLLQQGIAAVKSGDKERAYQLLMRATQDSAQAEQAWVWLSAVVGQDAERLFCLENALHANPNNTAAQRGAALLRQKGVFPAVPVGPMVQTVFQPAQASSAPVEKIVTPQVFPPYAPAPRPQAPAPHPAQAGQQDISSLVKFVAQELAHKTPRMLIQKNLVAQGLSPEAAADILKQTEAALRKVRREKAKKRMLRGFWWTLGGVAVTVLTNLFAKQLGGYFVIWYGAIIWGIIDLLAGFFSWMANQ